MDRLPLVFRELYSDLPQHGPGSDETTRRALRRLPDLPERPRILDVGCGAGRQCLCLAEETRGRVTAVDTHLPFLGQLKTRAGERGLSDRVHSVNASMHALPFKNRDFDLIWSEGAIYIIGFERGLREWQALLKPGGLIGVSEISWLTDTPPDELKQYWSSEYAGIATQAENIVRSERAGYRVIDCFTLPASDWWENFYNPLKQRARELRDKYRDRSDSVAVIESTEKEIELYERYSDYYGYVFYLLSRLPL